MTEEFDEQTAQPRRLAALLRDLRLGAGLTGEQLGAAAGMSQSKVSKIETGRQVPAVADVEAWAQAVDAVADVRADLVERAEAALTEATTWRAGLRQGVAHKQQQIGRLEQAASVTRLFQPALVPGLLQTAEYARRVFASGEYKGGNRDVAAAVTARLERQQVLFDDTKRIEFLVTEGALRWRPGPGSAQVLAAQLDRIVALITLPAVTFGVIPLDVEMIIIPLHGFVIRGDPAEGEDMLVTVSTVTAELHIRDEADVAIYLETFNRLRQAAVFGDEARALLTAIMADLQRT